MTENPKKTEKPKKQRLLALDILRGITIAGMLMVNNPGSWSNVYAPLRHAEWNGLTPTDLVFPFFMFIMGVSTWFSMRGYNFELTARSAWKIFRRSVIIFLIGLAIAWFGRTLRGVLNERSFVEAAFDFGTIRLLGVLPRLAICYGVGSFIALLCGKPNPKSSILVPRALYWIVGIFLVLYSFIVLLGEGYEFSENNIIYIVDNAIIGPDHLYTDIVDGVRLNLDPEGLVSTLPSIAHMLIGYICGGLIMGVADNRDRINRLFILGTILTFCGFLLSYGMPLNKKIWSPTFVLTTCGLASLLLGLLIWIIDIRGNRRWCRFFEVFGINPLFLYVFGTLLAITIGVVKIPYSGAETGIINITGWIYRAILVPVFSDLTLASFAYAVLFVITNWVVGLYLYKKKIYIKI